jgi:hypothetical protein
LKLLAKLFVATPLTALSIGAIAETLEQAWVDALASHQQLASAAAWRDSAMLDAEALRMQALGNHDDAHYEQTLARLRLARAAGLL